MPGQEHDKYDEVLKKAMFAPERGMSVTRLRTKQTFVTSDGKATFPLWETRINRTDRVWNPNNFTMNRLEEKVPLLLDRSNTPRGVQKEITLERTFDKDIWVYNKKSMDDFNATAKDIKQGKIYKKRIMRKKRQMSKSLSASRTASLSKQ